jgi:uncharacterized membrane protein HdeD (DUF308 family)
MSKLHPHQAAGGHRDPLFGNVSRNWAWMLALGLFYLALAGVGLAMLFGLTIVSILFIGILMLAGGAAQVLETVKAGGWKERAWHLVVAVLYLAGGLVVVLNPTSASWLISLAVGGVLASIGVVRILIARQLREKGGGGLWMLATGIAGIALGVMIMVEWPLFGLFAIAFFIAVELLLQGLTTIWLALKARWSRPAAA